MTHRNTRRFWVVWKDGGGTEVEVDESAQRLYIGESPFDIAATIACLSDDQHAQPTNIKYVREV